MHSIKYNQVPFSPSKNGQNISTSLAVAWFWGETAKVASQKLGINGQILTDFQQEFGDL